MSKKSDGLRSIRALAPESLRGVEPAKIEGRRPKFEWVDPADLFVEEDYQRSILENGVALIRKIYAGFSWSRFKPPICVRLPESGNVLVCIDGQHTATATASHPGIEQIPVMVVDAATVAGRASAFVGHNKDRLSLTTVMIYAAELAAGDELALSIDRACRKAGANIPRRALWTSAGNKHPVGTTASIGAIKAIAKRQGEEALVRVLSVLVAAERGPIKSVEIAAAALVCALHPESIDARLAKIIKAKSAEEWTGLGQVEAAQKGTALAVEVAGLWCAGLDLAAPQVTTKGNATDHARLIAPTPRPDPPKAAPPEPKSKLSANVGAPVTLGNPGVTPEKRKLYDMLAEAAANTARLPQPEQAVMGEREQGASDVAVWILALCKGTGADPVKFTEEVYLCVTQATQAVARLKAVPGRADQGKARKNLGTLDPDGGYRPPPGTIAAMLHKGR